MNKELLMSGNPRKGEEGIALIVVLLLGLVALALATALVSYGGSSTPVSRASQDWNASLSSAEGGLDDYIHRLSIDGNYWTYTTPPDGNQALSQPVPLPGPTNEAQFEYKVDEAPTPAKPTVRVTVTGTYRNSQRSIQATLRRTSFLDFLYATDFETKDPLAYDPAIDGNAQPGNVPKTITWAQNNCQAYRFAKTGLPARHANCSKIVFITADTLNGPVHSNDSLLIDGNPTFKDKVGTNWTAAPVGKEWVDNRTSSPLSAPVFEKGIFVKNYLPIPKANSALRELANGTITGSGSGCLYTGPTRITLRNDGKYDVVSPRTVSTKPGCGPGTAIAIPQNGVIYVQNVFPYGSGDPNANPLSTSPCSYKNTGSGAPWLACGTPNAAGVTYPPGLPVPLKDDKTNDSSVEKYIHTNGDLFISGTLKGRLTVGAQNDIVVVEDVRYSDTGPSSTDILGMIPQNSVKVFHPVNKNTGANIGSTWSDGNATIYAAMLAISRSISVQNYNQGNPLGLLSVRGVMAQKYRGIVGTSSGGTPVSGFAKDYLYDGRLQVQSPPHFLDPVRTAWEVKTWAEVDTPPEHKSGT